MRQTYWSLELSYLATNQWKSIPVNLTAAIDTGTTLIYVPDDVASRFYQLVSISLRPDQREPSPCLNPLFVDWQIRGSKQALQYGPGAWPMKLQ